MHSMKTLDVVTMDEWNFDEIDEEYKEPPESPCFDDKNYECLWEEFHAELSRYFDRREKNSGAEKMIRRDGLPLPLKPKVI
jgi:hypothetical protein